MAPVACAGAKPARPAKWKNPQRHLPAARAAVQGAYTGFLLLVGYDFSTWVSQLLTGAPRTVVRPPAVEAFLPISALLGLKRCSRRVLLVVSTRRLQTQMFTIIAVAIVLAFFASREVPLAWGERQRLSASPAFVL
jgi:hypothetical protein